LSTNFQKPPLAKFSDSSYAPDSFQEITLKFKSADKVALDVSGAKHKKSFAKLDGAELAGVKTDGASDDEIEAAVRADADRLREELVELQAKLYGEGKQRLLIVLQAMDTGGKDGCIRNVFSGCNPLGVKVARFEKPTSDELARDYLWRVHSKVPDNGHITIFNRSHYEDVLVVRVQNLVPEKRWAKRYEQIRHFESLLVDEGTKVLKFFLHIDKDEQKERLQARLDDPAKLWKFDPNDLTQREKWADYMQAYADAVHKTHQKHAPWFVIPAKQKWYRDWAVLKIVVHQLKDMNPKFPKPSFDPATVVIK
jgi:PPK2 family polyphosphate:nucleotide phosphotransferase